MYKSKYDKVWLRYHQIRKEYPYITNYNCLATAVFGKHLNLKDLLDLFKNLVIFKEEIEDQDELWAQLKRLNSVQEKEFDGRRGDFRFRESEKDRQKRLEEESI